MSHRRRALNKKYHKTLNEQAREKLLNAGYEIIDDLCGSGQVGTRAAANPRSNLFRALREARLRGYKDVHYEVGAGLRFASQGYYFFVGGKN